jgi:hypothetical protein
VARIDPAEVRARYGVDPVQVPDFIALRGDSLRLNCRVLRASAHPAPQRCRSDMARSANMCLSARHEDRPIVCAEVTPSNRYLAR